MFDRQRAVSTIAPSGLLGMMRRGEPLAVLDVREPQERAFSAIGVGPESIDLHVPLGEVAARVGEILAASRGRTLVVYCHHGVRSMAAARWLAMRAEGPVMNLDGGIDAWSLEVDPGVPRYR